MPVRRARQLSGLGPGLHAAVQRAPRGGCCALARRGMHAGRQAASPKERTALNSVGVGAVAVDGPTLTAARCRSEREGCDKYSKKFWPQFGKAIKLGIMEDAINRNRLAKLLRFK